MDEKSTTPGNNPQDSDITAGDTTAADSKTGTDNQPGDNANNLDDSSKSTDNSAADDDKKSTTDTSDKKDDTPASQFDEDLGDWITKRGLPEPTDDAQKQKYQDLRNEQREFTRSQQEKRAADDAKELGKAVNDAKADQDSDDDDDEGLDPLEKRVKQNEDALAEERVTRQQSEFYRSNSVTPEQHKEILSVMKEKFAAPTTPEGKKRAVELWSSPEALPDLLDLAKARLGSAEKATIADEAAQQEREKIARESQAKSPGRSASQHTSSDKTEDEARLERFKARYNKS